MAEVRSSAPRARFDWTLSTPLAELRRGRVGSLNEPKLEAVRNALAPYAPEVEVAGVFRISRGRITDLRLTWDNLGLLAQLGHVAPPAPAPHPNAPETDPESGPGSPGS